jgi:antitoxin ParD1/3/4
MNGWRLRMHTALAVRPPTRDVTTALDHTHGRHLLVIWRRGGETQGLPPRGIAKLCQTAYAAAMSTMNVSLPETLKSFVDEQVKQRGYGTSSEYVRELIRRDQSRQQLRSLLLTGASSTPSAPVDTAYFEGLRERVRGGLEVKGKIGSQP